MRGAQAGTTCGLPVRVDREDPSGSFSFLRATGALSEKASASAAQRRCAYTRLSTSRARPALCVAGRSRGPCPTVWAASAVRAGNGGPRGHRGSGRGGDHLRLARRIPVRALRFLCAAHRSVSRPPVCLSTLGGPFLTPQSGVQLAHSVCWRVRPQGHGPHTACAPSRLPAGAGTAPRGDVLRGRHLPHPGLRFPRGAAGVPPPLPSRLRAPVFYLAHSGRRRFQKFLLPAAWLSLAALS